MDDYDEGTHSGAGDKLIILLFVVLALVALALVTDTPGRIADAQAAHERTAQVQAQVRGDVELARAYYAALAAGQAQGVLPLVSAVAGVLVGWWARGREGRGIG